MEPRLIFIVSNLGRKQQLLQMLSEIEECKGCVSVWTHKLKGKFKELGRVVIALSFIALDELLLLNTNIEEVGENSAYVTYLWKGNKSRFLEYFEYLKESNTPPTDSSNYSTEVSSGITLPEGKIVNITNTPRTL